MRSLSLTAVLSTALWLAACAQQPTTPPVNQADLAERTAKEALLAGIRLYDDGQYPEAEKQFGTALKLNLASAKDRAAAHKYLAFIYCTSNRQSLCESSFRAAMQADPAFALSKSEAGHPQWGPVYQRVQR